MIRRAPSRDRWTTLPLAALEDKRLSWKARGLLAFILAKPDDWEIRREHLIKSSKKDGISSVKGALKELRDCGYAVLTQVRTDDNARAHGMQYVFYDTPKQAREAGILSEGNPIGQNTNGQEIDGQKTYPVTKDPVLLRSKEDLDPERHTQNACAREANAASQNIAGEKRRLKPLDIVDDRETYCHVGRDGDCRWEECPRPQNRDGGPRASGRHCPLDSDNKKGWETCADCERESSLAGETVLCARCYGIGQEGEDQVATGEEPEYCPAIYDRLGYQCSYRPGHAGQHYAEGYMWDDEPMSIPQNHACMQYHPGFPCGHEQNALAIVGKVLWGKSVRLKSHPLLHAFIHESLETFPDDVRTVAVWWRENRKPKDWSIPLMFSRPGEVLATAQHVQAPGGASGLARYVEKLKEDGK